MARLRPRKRKRSKHHLSKTLPSTPTRAIPPNGYLSAPPRAPRKSVTMGELRLLKEEEEVDIHGVLERLESGLDKIGYEMDSDGVWEEEVDAGFEVVIVRMGRRERMEYVDFTQVEKVHVKRVKKVGFSVVVVGGGKVKGGRIVKRERVVKKERVVKMVGSRKRVKRVKRVKEVRKVRGRKR